MERGCGTREAGGVYMELGLDEQGVPVEHFLLDPPRRLDQATQQALGIRPIGVSTLADPQRPGVVHLVDWIGSSHYPNVADFVEEVRRFGLSRRLGRNFDFGQITPESRLLCVHANGWLENAAEYQQDRRLAGAPARCVKSVLGHGAADYDGMCASLFWQDVFGGEALEPGLLEAALAAGLNPHMSTRRVTRRMPSFDYHAFAAPKGVQVRYTPAIFASFPLSRIVVIKDRDDSTRDADTLRKVSRAGVPVDLEDK